MTKITPDDFLRKLYAIVPDFAESWTDPENPFRDGAKPLSFHAVCAQFSHWKRDNWNALSSKKKKEVAGLVNAAVEQIDSDMSNAMTTCFLENLATERPGNDIAKLLQGNAAAFMSQFNEG